MSLLTRTNGTSTQLLEAHLQEVRLLQRGLQARGNGEMRCGATASRWSELQNPAFFQGEHVNANDI